MRDFIDKTSEQNGTPLNRAYMMAIQGFDSVETTFRYDGSIFEKNALGETKTTTFNNDGSIVEKFVGNKTITKTTRFIDGQIMEVIS